MEFKESFKDEKCILCQETGGEYDLFEDPNQPEAGIIKICKQCQSILGDNKGVQHETHPR